MRRAAEAATQRYLLYYEEIRRLHHESLGAPLREYKPTEPERLLETFHAILESSAAGTAFLADLMHELVWAQSLGNANHRTTILFLEGLLSALGIPFPSYAGEADSKDRFKASIERFSERSHRQLDRQSEFGYNPKQLKKEHRVLCEGWLRAELGSQSRVDTMVGPQRLMAFFSSGES